MRIKVTDIDGILRSKVAPPARFARLPISVTKDSSIIEISVQGSDGHYCCPRTNLKYLTDYSEVEVAFLNGKNFVQGSILGIQHILPDIENDDVYGYVPISKVKDILYYLATNGWELS